jgi:hypothetical protein
MSDPLIGHLSDLCRTAPSGSFILGGGLALRVRRDMLLRSGARTLARAVGHQLPEARVTTDIDVFLRLEVFERGDRSLRVAIDKLGYGERTPKWQFEKELLPGPGSAEGPGAMLVLDLLARTPEPGSEVRMKPPRVGSGSGADLHGRVTEEAFAVEQLAREIPVVEDGITVARPLVAHPYAMLCMKLRASHDWLQYRQEAWSLSSKQKPPSEKHTFDAALCVAMLTEAEQDECIGLAREYAGRPVALAIRSEAKRLFGAPEAPGWRSAVAQGMFDAHAPVWDALGACLGVG